MAGKIRQEDVDAVRERTDIVKVVSGYLQLKKAGADSMVGLCPFHPEKTPSLSVSPRKQAYYCFGCGEGGGVFRFIQKIENLRFGEAVERLAKEAGVTLRYEGQSPAERQAAGRRQSLYKAIGEAARLYHQMLLTGREAEEARAYLRDRGIAQESVEGFAIGYAPGYPDFLLRRLAKAFSPEALVEAGLVSKDASGALRDRFRGRVTFPIHDLSGNSVGFGGRLLAGPRTPAGAAKYVNSPDSSVYHKGTLLYNLSRAKGDITRAGRAFVVEGYTDVIALDQAGIPEAVATCGTALGEEHIRLLSRFTQRAVLSFDSDEAGARAAERAYAFHENYDIDLSVLVLPEGEDPADFIQRNGGLAAERFRALVERAVPLVEYMIDRLLIGRELTNPEEQARAVKDGIEIVTRLEDPVRREKYAAVLADGVGVSVDSVLLELQRSSGPVGSAREPESARDRPRMSPSQKVEREALKILIQAPHLVGGRANEIREDRFSAPVAAKVLAFVKENAGAEIADLISRAQDQGEQLGKAVATLAFEPLAVAEELTEAYAEKVFLRLEEFALTRQIESMRKELQRLNPLTYPDAYDQMFEQLVALESARRKIRVLEEESGSAA